MTWKHGEQIEVNCNLVRNWVCRYEQSSSRDNENVRGRKQCSSHADIDIEISGVKLSLPLQNEKYIHLKQLLQHQVQLSRGRNWLRTLGSDHGNKLRQGA